jgi:glyoxylase-like metal-dependent hydrolase (beta-lactamase superfamily II)/8-oxo-dGTP pyrophosphatase MutT (NUDIX family)
MTAPAPLAPAASILLLRGQGGPGLREQDEPEIYLVHRSPRLRFLGGFHAFPGGKVDPDDAVPEGTPHGTQRRAAVRELFEETGVLLVSGTGADRPQWRRDLLAGTRTFTDLLATLGQTIDPAPLPHAGNLATPPFSPMRFDTAFFVADCPVDQAPEVWPGELESGRWLTARAALAAWNTGEFLLSPPTVSLLLALAGKSRAEFLEACRQETARLAAAELPPLWFCPGVRMIPLRSPALPPAAYTNAFLVGTGPVYLIDPGATEPAEQEKLFRVLDAEPRPLTAVILTHHHIDHIGSATAVAERYRVPVWAHADAAALLRGQVDIARHLEDGCILDLGESPGAANAEVNRRERWAMHGLLTPGHAPGHLAFHFPHLGLLLAADMVSTLSSVLVAPPEGNLRDYLASLRRLQTLPLRLLLPAHGGPSTRPEQVLGDALAHRLERERQLLDALGSGPRMLAELVPEVYRGVPRELWSLAELQLRGNLDKLLVEGTVVCRGNDAQGPWERVRS